MSKIEKSLRREAKSRKERDSQFQNVRYNTRRAGEGLIRREVERTTHLVKENK